MGRAELGIERQLAEPIGHSSHKFLGLGPSKRGPDTKPGTDSKPEMTLLLPRLQIEFTWARVAPRIPIRGGDYGVEAVPRSDWAIPQHDFPCRDPELPMDNPNHT